MLRIESLVGASTDPGLHEHLHHLEHHGDLEVVKIAVGDLDRRRLLARTERGEELAIALPRDQKLFDGAVLLMEAKRAIVVKAGEQRWLRLLPRAAEEALELGYHAGNLHWRVRFEGRDLLVSLDGPAADYIARIEPLVRSGRVLATEEQQ
ncbi:urease accessory protein UreE [Labrys sp. KB_33_2]|uniref:urease accessory protein UreE n=1 Tax=Labrys sp. KB_33_2 TaxID=3237479 RepID=UPI003F907EBD